MENNKIINYVKKGMNSRMTDELCLMYDNDCEYTNNNYDYLIQFANKHIKKGDFDFWQFVQAVYYTVDRYTKTPNWRDFEPTPRIEHKYCASYLIAKCICGDCLDKKIKVPKI